MIKTIKLFPTANKIINGEVSLPGSKSFTNRALIAAALVGGESTILNASESDDSTVLRKALAEYPKNKIVDVGPAGTAMRFLTALFALTEKTEVILRGSGRMHERPIKDLVDVLNLLGAKIDYLEREGCPPLKIRGVKISGDRKVSLPGTVSSQFVSGLLLAAPLIEGSLTVTITSELTSSSYVDMTLSVMKAFGIEARHERNNFIVSKSSYKPTVYTVEGDASGASYFWSLAAISGGCIKVKNLPRTSLQGDYRFPQLLKEMGCEVTYGDDFVTVKGGKLSAITCSMEEMPDTAQSLAVVAAVADGVTKIKGLATLRTKETDRIQAMVNELTKIGIKTENSKDSLTIYGGEPKLATIKTYDDHRMAMAFAPICAVLPGLEIEDPGVVTKSFPNFWEVMQSLGIRGEER